MNVCGLYSMVYHRSVISSFRSSLNLRIIPGHGSHPQPSAWQIYLFSSHKAAQSFRQLFLIKWLATDSSKSSTFKCLSLSPSSSSTSPTRQSALRHGETNSQHSSSWSNLSLFLRPHPHSTPAPVDCCHPVCSKLTYQAKRKRIPDELGRNVFSSAFFAVAAADSPFFLIMIII